MALLMIFDGSQKPPVFNSMQHTETVQESIRLADDLAKSDPAKLYDVYDNSGNLAYRR